MTYVLVPRLSLAYGIALGLLAGLVVAPPAAADQGVGAGAGAAFPACTSDPVACGKEQFELGAQAFDARDYARAILHFERAQELRPHPVIAYNLGLSLAAAGRVSEGMRALDVVLADPRADVALKSRAQKEREALRPRVAELRLGLRDTSATSVEVDGTVRDAGAPVHLLDPGVHRLRVTHRGAVVYDEELSLGAGERVELKLASRERSIEIVVVPPPRAPAASPVAPSAAPGSVSPAWFWAGVAVTGALLGGSVASGVDTLNARDAYERDLPRLTQQQADDRVARGHGKELRTNLLLGATVLSGAATAILGVWFVDFDGGRAEVSVAPGIARCSLTF